MLVAEHAAGLVGGVLGDEAGAEGADSANHRAGADVETFRALFDFDRREGRVQALEGARTRVPGAQFFG